MTPRWRDIGAWPWPRDLMAEVMQEIGDAGPKAVAMDILYTEPKQTRLEPRARGRSSGDRPGGRNRRPPSQPHRRRRHKRNRDRSPRQRTPAALPPNDGAADRPFDATRPTVIPGFEVNEDAVLANTIRRLNDVILAVSLKLNTDPSHFYPDVRELLVQRPGDD